MDKDFETNNDNLTPKKNKEFSLKKELFEWFYTIVIALIVAFLIKGFLFDIVEVDGPSMYPTLADGDRLVVTKLMYTPEQGDIVILDATFKNRNEYYEIVAAEEGKDVNGFYKLTKYFSLPSSLKSKYYVKRIIALGGQTVDIKNGKVYVDDKLLDEPYYDGITYAIDPELTFPITVDEGFAFVMGDNRPQSLDSRSSSLGLVPEEALVGKSRLRIWPISNMGITK